MPSDDQATGADIVDATRNQIGSLCYKLYGYSNNTPSGVPKDDHFIANTLDNAGLAFGGNPSARPSAADWADPNSTIPGWMPVTDGSIRAGDVLATSKPAPRSWYEGGGQQLGIATGDGTSVGVVDNNRVGESDFGFRDGHNPTVWRSALLANASSPEPDAPSASPPPTVKRGTLPPPPNFQGCPVGTGGSCPWNPNGGKGKIPGTEDKMQANSPPIGSNMPIAGTPDWDLRGVIPIIRR